jgi:hypothetical protein
MTQLEMNLEDRANKPEQQTNPEPPKINPTQKDGPTHKRQYKRRVEPARASKDEKPEFAKSKEQLAEILGASNRTLDRYIARDDSPKKYKAKGYNIQEWIDYAREVNINCAIARKSQSELKERIMALDIQLKTLNLEEEKGLLIDKEKAVKDMITLANLFKTALDNLPQRFVKYQNEDLIKDIEKVKNEILKMISDHIKRL